MKNDIEIIQITEAYIESFHACFDSVARERFYLGRLKAPPLENVKEFVLKKIAKDIVHLVAITDETVVGWCDIHPFEKEGFTHVGVLGMGIDKEYRGQGLGKKLLNTAIERAKEKGLERIELEVYNTNKVAIHLYEKAGFEVEGIKRKARKLDGKYYDKLCMALLF